ncbi:LytR C-terminal domain-containing protein [Pengzhenrongella frigida]|uniref:LytR family transcriptional regulator n=1 Tax=Pengzhenrongella frigida TaxID=1259133 RepID=A0A4Q5N0X7_9MICO|nr:LytR C-terminal domain-containing protein [Cellulomonas sp. HLT2-17]RYV51700.1 LytR family transcriptional regulator [Cellulomonas sp. HLT2-17]
MNEPQGPERARVLRRRHRHERQAALFGVLITTLIVVALGAFAIFTDAIPAPFARGFTTAAPEAGALTEAPPCPPEGTLPVAYQDVQVNVLNATRRAGLATETANALTSRGFMVLTTGNSTTAPSGAAQINFGATGLGAAYTLAAQIEGATLVLDARVDATVDLIVGAEFAALLDPTTIVLDPAVALTGVEGCVPLADAVPAPAPVPAVTDAPAAAAG